MRQAQEVENKQPKKKPKKKKPRENQHLFMTPPEGIAVDLKSP